MENTEIKKIIAVSIVKNSDGDVLIIKRKPREKDKGGPDVTWVFPGGVIEGNESELEAAVRETLHEIGYMVEAHDVISRRTFPNSNVFIHYVACGLISSNQGQIIEHDEVDEVKWVQPANLKDHFTTDFDKVVAVYLGLIL